MKKTIFTFLILALISFAAGSVYSQDESMQKWMEYMTPGDMHKMLEKHSGNWTAKTTFWMAPGTEPMSSDATMTSEMILGGRYLMSKYKGDMMGMPFEGMAIEAYDNGTKMFYSTWVDNMGTGLMYMKGKWNEASKQIEYTGDVYDPSKGATVTIRQVFSANDDGTTKLEMFGPGPDGNEFKTMEIISTKN
jgi:hypothetical protein